MGGQGWCDLPRQWEQLKWEPLLGGSLQPALLELVPFLAHCAHGGPSEMGLGPDCAGPLGLGHANWHRASGTVPGAHWLSPALHCILTPPSLAGPITALLLPRTYWGCQQGNSNPPHHRLSLPIRTRAPVWSPTQPGLPVTPACPVLSPRAVEGPVCMHVHRVLCC